MSFQRKTGKEGRKRTFSLVSNTSTIAQSPVASTKTVKNNSPSQTKDVKQPPKSTDAGTHQQHPDSAKGPNVFEFLDENDESSSDSESSSESSSESESESESEDEKPEPPRPKQITPKIQAPNPRARLPHGGSTGENTKPKPVTPSSSASKSPNEPRKPAAPPTRRAPSPDSQLVTQKRQAAETSSPTSTKSSPPGKRQMELSRPPKYHGPDARALHRPSLPPSPPRSPEESLHCTTPVKRRVSTGSQVSGYELLASQLTNSATDDKDAFPPLYRRFESVNHRVLLHLQDEISQMEEDLHSLDEYEEMHRIATAEQEGTRPLPASRRRDSQAQAYSALHYRRMDLMSAMVQKTEQYNTALCAYSKVLRDLPPASEKDIDGYRGWMKKRHPIASAESRFLDHRSDLVSLAPRPIESVAAAPAYVAIIIASAAILLPLLAFNMIAEFSGRLVVVTVVGGAAAAIAANYHSGADTVVDSKDGWRCATLYFGFMTLAAMFIP